MTLANVYGDRGGSGLTLKKRPEFRRMMRDCMDGKIDLILTKSVSRFARNLGDCVDATRLLRERGIPVLFEKEGMNSFDPGSELLLSVLAIMAQQEAHTLSESILWSLENRNASGRPTRIARYGYRRVENGKDGKVWRVCEPEAKRVRLAFRMAALGETCKSIRLALSDMEIGEGTGVRWQSARVRALLRSEVYVGDILTNKYFTADYLTKKVVRNDGQRQQYYLKEHHEPLVERAIYEKISQRIPYT